MTAILRVRAKWSGFNGAPGYSVLHFRDFGTGTGPGTDGNAAQAQQATDRARGFFDAIKGLLPQAVKIDMDSTVDLLEDTTGQLQDAFNVTPGAQMSGSGTTGYAASAGAVVNWKSDSVRNGRRIRGRTFLVPLLGTAFSAGGVLSAASLPTIQTAATALIDRTGTPDLGIYARPSGPGVADGRWVVATGATVPSLAAVLTSRRD